MGSGDFDFKRLVGNADNILLTTVRDISIRASIVWSQKVYLPTVGKLHVIKGSVAVTTRQKQLH